MFLIFETWLEFTTPFEVAGCFVRFNHVASVIVSIV